MKATDSSTSKNETALASTGGETAPVATIIVPTYNTADYLPELVDSIINQYLTSWQLVIIDDGSTDNTPEVIEPYTSTYPAIEYYRIANGGPGHARNVGLRYAKGTWLMFADADDILPKHALRDLVALGEREGCDIVTGDVKRLVNGQRLNSTLHRLAFNEAKEGRTTIYESPSLLYDTTACNKIFRRAFFERAGITWTEGRFYEDESTVMPSYFEAESIGVLKNVVYVWRVRDKGSQSTTQQYATVKNFRDRLQTIRDVDAYIDSHVADDEMRLQKDHKWLVHDLRLYLNAFPGADDEFRQVVMDEVADYLPHVDRRAFTRLRAIDRIKYELVRRHDADGIARAVDYDWSHFPGLEVRRTDEGRFVGAFPFEDLSDEDADMTDELREHGVQTKVARVYLQPYSLVIEAVVQLNYLVQHEATVHAQLVDDDGIVVAETDGTCKALAATSADAKRFDREGSAFAVKLRFGELDQLVGRLAEGTYRIELQASFEDLSCEPATLGNPYKGSYPRPYPVLIDNKVSVVDYDTNWRLTLKVEAARHLVRSMRLEDNRRFVFELADGSAEQFEVPTIGAGDQRTFEFEQTQLLDTRPHYFVRRTALNVDGVQEGFMLAAPGEKATDTPETSHGFELWRAYANTKGHVRLQMIRPGAIVTRFEQRQAFVSLWFAFPLPHEVTRATLVLGATDRPDIRIPLDREETAGGGQQYGIQLDCASGVLATAPLGTYGAKVELELGDGSLTGWAWCGEPRGGAITYVKAEGRTFGFDRRGSSLYLSIWQTPTKS